jgi:hypothetical protein
MPSPRSTAARASGLRIASASSVGRSEAPEVQPLLPGSVAETKIPITNQPPPIQMRTHDQPNELRIGCCRI